LKKNPVIFFISEKLYRKDFMNWADEEFETIDLGGAND
jgi:hypothetical protein